MSFTQFVSYAVRYQRNITTEQDDDPSDTEYTNPTFSLQDNLESIRKRTTDAIIKYPHLKKSLDTERYCHNILRVY